MYRYEFRLKIVLGNDTTYVHTIITAGSPIQARAIAQSQCGAGEIIFGPYPID